MFVVLYRWRLIAGSENSFIGAWSEVTNYYLENFDSLGSRLHKGNDGIWYAYAQWKSAGQRENASENSLLSEKVFEKMSNSVEERLPEIVLEIEEDLFKNS